MSDIVNYHKLLSNILRTRRRHGDNLAVLRLGDLLSLAGVVSKEYVKSALKTQRIDKKKLGEILVSQGFVTDEQVLATLAVKYGFDFVDIKDKIIPTSIIAIIPPPLARKLRVIPLEFQDNSLVVAIADPAEHSAVEDLLRFTLNRRIRIVISSKEQIDEALDNYYSRKAQALSQQKKQPGKESAAGDKVKGSSENIEDIIDEMVDDEGINLESQEEENQAIAESDSLVIKLVNNILISASSKGVSDIHFEPRGLNGQILVRFRLDGICHDAHVIAPIYERAIVSRLKILANLDITERRRPQSGKITFKYLGAPVEYRVEFTPTTGGHEDAVLRILTKSSQLSLEDISLSEENLRNFKRVISKPYGLVLCVGPTGSGKTTTLHGALNYINTPERKIWTAEDPVEIEQERLRQVQINPEIGLTFQAALRSFLRADPDVIMVGEMRDFETTNMAIEAALTGHLVFGTMHTNTAAETISRLVGMGIEPFNFADSLVGVLAQRLCRRICRHCRKEYIPSPDEFAEIVEEYGEDLYRADGLPSTPGEMQLYSSGSCLRCHKTGYVGRLAVHELLVNSADVKTAIQKGEKSVEIYEIAIAGGMRSLMMDGICKVVDGKTTLQELRRVAR